MPTGRNRTTPRTGAVREFVESNGWQIAAIEAGMRDAESGRFIDHARLKARWETRLALVLAKAR